MQCEASVHTRHLIEPLPFLALGCGGASCEICFGRFSKVQPDLFTQSQRFQLQVDLIT